MSLLRSVNEVNEDVLQPGVDPAPFVLVGAKWRDGSLQGGGIVSAYVQGVAERDGLLDTGTIAERLGKPA